MKIFYWNSISRYIIPSKILFRFFFLLSLFLCLFLCFSFFFLFLFSLFLCSFHCCFSFFSLFLRRFDFKSTISLVSNWHLFKEILVCFNRSFSFVINSSFFIFTLTCFFLLSIEYEYGQIVISNIMRIILWNIKGGND